MRGYLAFLFFLVTGLVLEAIPDAIVAQDGSGQFRSVQAAIDAAPQLTRLDGPHWIILVKNGTYRERIYIQREKRFITLTGEDARATAITYDLKATQPGPGGVPIGTFRTPTVQIDADDFTVKDISFVNTAGPVGPAIALRVDGDRVVFKNCRLLGWQDTLLVNRGRHYFEDCYIEGHVDFIFGGATAYFERCEIHCLKDGYITAASTPQNQPYGLIFADGAITSELDAKTYLGRPWRAEASTVFLRMQMSDAVRPEGWHNWSKAAAEKTTRYGEFANTGPGANPAGRVNWVRFLASIEAERLTPAKVLGGSDGWCPAK